VISPSFPNRKLPGRTGEKMAREAASILRWPLAWATVSLLLMIDVVWASQIGLTIGRGEIPAGVVGVLLAISAGYRRRSRAISDMAGAGAMWGAVMSTGVILSYLAATCALPLRDTLFAQGDHAFGFNWLAWRNATLSLPVLGWLFLIAYYSFQFQTAFSIIYFTASGRTSRIEELLLLASVTLVVTILISAIWPALGPYPEHFSYAPELLALRAGGAWHFDFLKMQGIISMPSYHTVAAVLFIYAFRRTGRVGYIVLALNLVMLLSIPPVGGHYLVDVLAGAALALGAIIIQRAWQLRRANTITCTFNVGADVRP
jgi:membrane-associated phospholipid phosphatase